MLTIQMYRKEFLKPKDNKNLFKINNVPRKIKQISLIIY